MDGGCYKLVGEDNIPAALTPTGRSPAAPAVTPQPVARALLFSTLPDTPPASRSLLGDNKSGGNGRDSRYMNSGSAASFGDGVGCRENYRGVTIRGPRKWLPFVKLIVLPVSR